MAFRILVEPEIAAPRTYDDSRLGAVVLGDIGCQFIGLHAEMNGQQTDAYQ